MEIFSERRKGCVVVFDSGIGGLNLLYECARRMPFIRYYYISDSANVPYGNRGGDEIYKLTASALNGIENLDPLALVLACNTVTANCIDKLRAKFPFPVVGIQPAVKPAEEWGGRSLVLATEATIGSKKFLSSLSSYKSFTPVLCGCRNLAAYIEENVTNLPPTLPCGLLPDVVCDSVVIGCTHYTFIKEHIKRKYECPVFDGTEGVADHFAKILGKVGHLSPLTGKNVHRGTIKFKITFIGADKDKNKAIFKNLFAN